MLDELNENVEQSANQVATTNAQQNDALDTKLLSLPLRETEKQIIQGIVDAENKEVLEARLDEFNVNLTKMNAIRAAKLNLLLGKIEDQAIERFNKRPDQVSNKELLDYMQVVSGQIDRSQKYIESLSEKPAITLKQNNKTEVNINVGPQLDRDGKDHVMDAVSALLKQLQKPSEPIIDAEVVDVNTDDNLTENDEKNEISETETVSNNDYLSSEEEDE